MYTYEYPHPAVTVDIVIFTIRDEQLKLLLIRRACKPYMGKWALPGGFVNINEDLDTAARRELKEETGVSGVYLEQLYTFGAPKRDPRERVITVAYYTLIPSDKIQLQAATDAEAVGWFGMDELPKLAFDHDRILQTAYERLQGKIRYQPIGFELLPQKFTLRQLQQMYEKILDRKLDKRNFRKKILKMGIIQELDEIETDVAHRAARLYKFNKTKYDQMVKQGFNFEI